MGGGSRLRTRPEREAWPFMLWYKLYFLYSTAPKPNSACQSTTSTPPYSLAVEYEKCHSVYGFDPASCQRPPIPSISGALHCSCPA